MSFDGFDKNYQTSRSSNDTILASSFFLYLKRFSKVVFYPSCCIDIKGGLVRICGHISKKLCQQNNCGGVWFQSILLFLDIKKPTERSIA